MDDERIVIRELPSQGFEIRSIWAWLAVDGDGEGIIGASINGHNYSLVASTLDTAMSLRRYAHRAAVTAGRTVRLVRFDQRTVVEEIEPPQVGAPPPRLSGR